jgi:transcription initiation factor TFIID subunit 1, fungi type
MEYHRRGPHQGFWRLKMVTPEQVVLAESMQVGQRHLQDSGYSYNGEEADDDEGNLSIEQQLAPWITTKNFLFATQAKAMLRLHGEGDPSGRGEAFSFIRVSMKDIFVKAGEDYDLKLGMYFYYSPTCDLTIAQLKRRIGQNLLIVTTLLNNKSFTSLK